MNCNLVVCIPKTRWKISSYNLRYLENNQGTAFFTLFVTNEAKFVEATLTVEQKTI